MTGLSISLLLSPLHHLRATTEEVCIAVSVIGPDDGDPGTGNCGSGTPVVSSSSVSSSSVSSSSVSSSLSSSSDVSSAVSSDSTSSVTVAVVTPPDLPTGSLGDRIDEKINRWARLHRTRPAAPVPCDGAWYEDVPDDVWFTAPVRAFRGAGYIDPACLFYPEAGATRAAFAKLLVVMSGGILAPSPSVPSFADVPLRSWYFPYTEEAGRRGWMIGYGDCYGTRPCFDKPALLVTRAEAAQMIVRFLHLSRNGYAPVFPDNLPDQWYTRSVQIAADHCVLLGDADTGLVRPNDHMNRAEMVTMLARAVLNLTYGVDCARGETSRIEQHTPLTPMKETLPRTAWRSLSDTLRHPATFFKSLMFILWEGETAL